MAHRSTDATTDLDLVARFVRVAEARSFAAAASRSGLPKSTLSRSVSRLEQNLGVRLLERTTRSLRLTDEGLRLFETASRGIATIDEALDLATDSPQNLRGTLRISAPPDLGETMLAELVVRFCERQPQVRVEMELSNRYVDLVKEGFDLALRAGVLRDSSLVARKLTDIGFGLYAATSHVQRFGLPKKPADLEGQEFVLFRPVNGEQRIQLRGPKGTSRLHVTGRVTSDDLTLVRRCCILGGGAALLPLFSGEADVATGRLVRLLPGYESSGGGLHLVYASSRLAPARLTAFRDFALEYFRTQPGFSAPAKRV